MDKVSNANRLRSAIVNAPLGSTARLDAVEALCDAEDTGGLTLREAEEIWDQLENQDG